MIYLFSLFYWMWSNCQLRIHFFHQQNSRMVGFSRLSPYGQVLVASSLPASWEVPMVITKPAACTETLRDSLLDINIYTPWRCFTAGLDHNSLGPVWWFRSFSLCKSVIIVGEAMVIFHRVYPAVSSCPFSATRTVEPPLENWMYPSLGEQKYDEYRHGLRTLRYITLGADICDCSWSFQQVFLEKMMFGRGPCFFLGDEGTFFFRGDMWNFGSAIGALSNFS